jgi:hypothetical protein
MASYIGATRGVHGDRRSRSFLWHRGLAGPYLEAAIDEALREGIMVSAVYYPSAGHIGHSYWQSYWGQIYLSKIADETGGEAYYIGFTGPPVAFTPYLDELGDRLSH